MSGKYKQILLKIFILLIKTYQYLLSPLLKNCCRFYPSCSQYAIESIQKYGFFGLFKAFIRILKCSPLSKGGFDPIR